jgi:hypothetical protein
MHYEQNFIVVFSLPKKIKEIGFKIVQGYRFDYVLLDDNNHFCEVFDLCFSILLNL